MNRRKKKLERPGNGEMKRSRFEIGVSIHPFKNTAVSTSLCVMVCISSRRSS